jgi:sulfotransferase family protein
MLFDALSHSPTVWTLDTKTQALVEGIRELASGSREDGNRLDAGQAPPAVAEALRAACREAFRGLGGREVEGGENVRLLERTPRNALRVPFLDAVFPEATFVYIYRDPRESLASMMAAWESGRFVTYPDLPSWPGAGWSLLLVPGWRRLRGRDLPEIVTEQWIAATTILLDDLERLGPERWCVVDYAALMNEPQEELERLCGFLGLAWNHSPPSPLPGLARTIEATDPERWQNLIAAIEPFLPRTESLARRAREWIAQPRPAGH